MPGIAGIISKTPKETNEGDLRQMIGSMLHEPFYKSGIYTNEGLGVYAGWVGHEGSFSDCIPVWNEKKNSVMLFFGENFPDLELFDHLKARHHRFDNANASYLIHLYEEKGMDFLRDLNGWFTGILVDIPAKKAFLFNDRYGMQKIFCYESREAFYFSSEAKALLEVCPELRELDLKSLGEFISCGCVLEQRTLFRRVSLLPGAAVVEFRPDGTIKKDRYFDPLEWENQPWLEKEFYYEKLRDTLKRILPRYFRSTQKIGISLTGGLDTRIIMAYMDMPPGKYPCYTFGGRYRDCYDVKVARKVAEALQQSHLTLPLDKKFLSEFQKYAEKSIAITDGYLDVSGSYELYLNELAREIAPVRITGNYGGEMLRGIEGMLKAKPPVDDLYSPEMKTYCRASKETLAHLYESSTHPITFSLFKEIPWLRNSAFVSEQSQLTPRTPYLDNDLVALVYRTPLDRRHDMSLSLRLIADGNQAVSAIPSDRGFGGIRRPPISQSYELYNEFLFKAEYAYNYGMPQWLAVMDHLFMPMHLEKIFLGRHKFAHFRVWYRDELADYVKSVLLDEKSLGRPYINRKSLENMVLSHSKGNRNSTTQISKALSLELMHRLILERN